MQSREDTGSQLDLTPRLEWTGRDDVGANERRAAQRIENPALETMPAAGITGSATISSTLTQDALFRHSREACPRGGGGRECMFLPQQADLRR